MATLVRTTRVDDLELRAGREVPASLRPTTFALDGVDYEIDLSMANRMTLYAALAPFITAVKRRARTRHRNRVPGAGSVSPHRI